MKFIVFGLGNFGAALGIKLVEMGHEVIGVDLKMELVDKFKNQLTHTVMLDATVKEAIQQLPIKDINAAIIGIGENEGATILTSALLKQMGVKKIICRVTSPLQQVVLEAMNIREFAYPEASSAERLALQLDMPGVINSFRIRKDHRILEVKVPERYVGKSVGDIQFKDNYNIVLVTVLREGVTKNVFGTDQSVQQVLGCVKDPLVLDENDVLLVFGHSKDLEKFID